MNRIEKYLKNPHGITAVILLGAVFGFISFKSLPLNLFPDTNYPKVSVLFIQKGASARDMADNISRPVEKELAGLELVRTVSSSVRDETAAVSVEFEYEKTLDAAVTAVNTALNKIRASLPSDMQPPRVFRISEAVQPVQTLAVTPAEGSGLDLTRIRQLCDNEVLEAFLRVPGIADVEIFGGYRPEIEVALDRDVMASYGISPEQVLSSVYAFNRNIPVGTLTRNRDRILIRIAEERDFYHELGHIVIGMNGGSPVHLEDIAKIGIRHKDRLSFYHGNGQPAIGLNVLRPENGHVTTTLAALEKNLPKIRKQFENLNFEMSDTQGELIRTSVNNLIGSLRDAVVLTVAVIFLMLAQTRMTILAAVSIPFTFLLTFAGMKLTGYELNIVTMTAVILAVGLLVDDAIVVIENIEKHARFPDKTPFRASVDGTREIFLSDFGGTVTTLAVLLPIMFAGGYSEKILRPLTVVLSLALISSFVVSVTIIPLLAGKLTRPDSKAGRFQRMQEAFLNFWIVPLQNMFVKAFQTAAGRWGFVIIPLVLVLLPLSIRQLPLAGRDLMPAMDTGIVKVSFETRAGSTIEDTEQAVEKIESIIADFPGYLRMSTAVGSEPSVVSFGAERTSEQGMITIHFVNRFERDRSIWEIEADLLDSFSKISGLKSVSVYDYGATPLSSIAAPVDVMISGPDPVILDSLAGQVKKRLETVKGLTSVSRSWDMDRRGIRIDLDDEKLAYYGIPPQSVSSALAAATDGIVASTFRVSGQDGQKVRLRFDRKQITSIKNLADIQVIGEKQTIALSEIADFEKHWRQSRITRQNLSSTVNVLGYRADTAISILQSRVDDALEDISPPAGYRIEQEGEIKHMKESFGRLGKSLGLALLLLFFSLTVIFKSYIRPLVVMSAIPLAFIGVPWAMILMDRHFCMPAAMGMILLAGIVVNNSILLVDFIENARAEGNDIRAAAEQAIRKRTRPILMTAFSTAAGMLPIAAEMAIGLERLSPLAVVAIAGLVVSTFLTLAYIPVVYIVVEYLKSRSVKFYRYVFHVGNS